MWKNITLDKKDFHWKDILKIKSEGFADPTITPWWSLDKQDKDRLIWKHATTDQWTNNTWISMIITNLSIKMKNEINLFEKRKFSDTVDDVMWNDLDIIYKWLDDQMHWNNHIHWLMKSIYALIQLTLIRSRITIWTKTIRLDDISQGYIIQ